MEGTQWKSLTVVSLLPPPPTTTTLYYSYLTDWQISREDKEKQEEKGMQTAISESVLNCINFY